MSIVSFDELEAKLNDTIKSKDTRCRLSIPPIEMLAVTLSKDCQATRLVVQAACTPRRSSSGVLASSRCLQIACTLRLRSSVHYVTNNSLLLNRRRSYIRSLPPACTLLANTQVCIEP
ncbi:hypothetical protein J6590_034247 [Homalodisca vitripennis]|nr:hypothetical protein J6590_034247 [Homalodisca vitripennis]